MNRIYLKSFILLACSLFLVLPQMGKEGFCAEKSSEQDYTIVSSGYENMTVTQFPDVCRLKDGSLLAVFYVGFAHVSFPDENFPKGGAICACTSKDDGRTWSELETIIDTEYDDRDPSIVQLKDGRILCNFFVIESDGKGGNLCTTLISESADNGKTWSESKVVYTDYATSSPIRVLSDGTLLMPLYCQGNNTAWGAVGLSHDQGKTWEKPIDIPNGEFRLDAETDVIELKDGSLYALEREQMGFSVSKDGGKSWSVSKDVGFPGEAPYLFRASNDVIVVTMREHNKTVMHISLDECATWSDTILVDDCQGAYPSIVERKDGSLLILYYEGGTTYPHSKIRAKCFKVSPKGKITWKKI